MLYRKVEGIYRYVVHQRKDDDGSVFYFSHEDFEGLRACPYPFLSRDGHRLYGCFYFYDDPIPGRIVIVEHGIGTGHRGYMREIELCARQGYLVFAYDHTGCMKSEGKTTGGFSHSLVDLSDAISALKRDSAYAGYTYSVIGHSWGGFSALNITSVHEDVKHVVAISGFRSVRVIMDQTLPFGNAKRIYAEEERLGLPYFHTDAMDTLALTRARTLIIHSDDDAIVNYNANFLPLQRAHGDKPHISFLAVTGKDHNPNYTEAAVAYKALFFKRYQSAQKKKMLVTEQEKQAFLKQYDFYRMTEQDPSVWQRIFETLAE